MTLERDIRDAARRRPAASRAGAAETLPDLPAAVRHRSRGRNVFTGSRAVLKARTPTEGTLVERAMSRLTAAVEEDGESLEMVPDAEVVRTSAGTAIVHLHQHHRGIPVYETVRSVHFDAGGRREIVGDHVQIGDDLDPSPRISAATAVMAAARYLAEATAAAPGSAPPGSAPPGGAPLKVSSHPPRLIGSFPLPSRPSMLAKQPFAEPVTAHLVWLYCGPGDIRLGWSVSLTTPEVVERASGATGSDEQYDLIVTANGAGAGEVLYCRSSYLCARGRATVFRHDPGGPGDRVDVDLPLPRDAYPAFAASGPSDPFGRPWITRRNTRGNNAGAFRRNRKSTFQGVPENGAMIFAPADPEGEDQCLLNAFYFCNYLHDFFSLLGFGEAEGNFQQENFTGAPGDRDPLEIRIYDRPVAGTARMRGRRDGRPGELQIGPRDDRHGALDADLVFHEYVHGVTTRLAGGRLSFEPLRHPESRALGEGYSDYFALTIQSHQLGEEKTVFCAWLGRDDDKGMRRQAYDDSFSLHYGDLVRPENQEPHHGGEIWCMALMRMNRAIGRALEDPERGHEIGWQLVVDSLKLLPVGPDQPGFLDARDAVTRALADLGATGRLDPADFAAVARAMGEAFAATGMGPAAAGRGAHFQDIVPDFTVPDVPNDFPGETP